MNHCQWPHTLTLARLHAAQGYFDQARQIYSRLIADAPADQSLAAEFEALEQKRLAAGTCPELPALFAEWITMLVRARFLACRHTPE